MGVSTHPDEEQGLMINEGFENLPEVTKEEPAIGVPTEAVQDSVVVINTVEPTVMHFWPACLSTFFCHIFGLACTMLYFNSKHGKAGAATGFAVHALKMALFSILAAVVVSSYHTPHHFDPDTLDTPAKCEAMHGEWNPYRHEPHHHHHHHHEQQGDMEKRHRFGDAYDHPCSCPKWYLELNNRDGSRLCIDSKHFWIKVAVVSTLFFIVCLLVRRHYLKDAVTIRQVAVIAHPQPGYAPAPTQGIVIHDL
eukprot:TRINITY_DN538_c0_g1_i2.p1 TRINITY_DN538_c0_g1~~TRINITY_DN538_c0_g1_i2.p1  ORF type:complete len:251 (+),score=83.94 TRINITY_DN538_c0_g1_i2:113-865(+)